MAAPAAAILAKRAAIAAVKNWRKTIPIVFGIFLFLFIPLNTMFVFLPSADTPKQKNYEAVAKDNDLDWIELIAYDTVLYDNSLDKTTPEKTILSLLQIDYKKYEEQTREVTETKEEVVNGVVVTKEVTYTVTEWVMVDSGIVTGYDRISEFLKKSGYNASSYKDMTISKVTAYCVKLDKTQEYDVTVKKLSFLDLVSNFDRNKKVWYFDLITALYDKNDKLGNDIKEYINPDGSYMVNTSLSETAYPLEDTSLLYGDVDVNIVFAGRLAALAKDFKEKINITSGYRSIKEQQAIWDATPPERRGTYVARPGTSRHQSGLAADVSGWSIYLTNDTLKKYGLYKPMDYENWHIEPIETLQ